MYREMMLEKRAKRRTAKEADKAGEAEARVLLFGGEGRGGSEETAEERRGARAVSTAVAVEKRRQMREDPEGWMRERLSSGGPARGTVEWRLEKRIAYSEAALRRSSSKGADGASATTRAKANLDRWTKETSAKAPPRGVGEKGVGRGLERGEARETREDEGAAEERRRRARREYMQAYRRRKALEGAAASQD